MAEAISAKLDQPAKRRPGRPRQDAPTKAYLERQGEIVDMAIEVFRERSYESSTLEDVAKSLQMSRASLYHYVPSKAHLLYLVFDRAISLALARMEEISAIADPSERLRALIEHQVHTIASNPSMFSVFFGDRPSLEDRYEAEIAAKERRYLAILIDAVREVEAAGIVPARDPHLVAQAILGMTSWLYKWYSPKRDDPDVYAKVCIDLIFQAEANGHR